MLELQAKELEERAIYEQHVAEAEEDATASDGNEEHSRVPESNYQLTHL